MMKTYSYWKFDEFFIYVKFRDDKREFREDILQNQSGQEYEIEQDGNENS